MLKKICWGVTFLSIIFINIGITNLMMNARQARASGAASSAAVDAPQQAQFINGFPVDGWRGPSFKPPFVTRDQLVKRDSVQELQDKSEITNLLYAFVFFHDTGNLQGMRSTFTKEGGIGGGYNKEGQAIEGAGCIGTYDAVGRSAVDTGGRMPKDGNPIAYPFPGHSKNITTNVLIQVHGDTAELRAYYTRVQANVEGEPPVVETKPLNAGERVLVGPHSATVLYTGQYVMDLQRTPEGWRFARQWHINDWRNAPSTGSPRPCPDRSSSK
jgi:hypothetical protein